MLVTVETLIHHQTMTENTREDYTRMENTREDYTSGENTREGCAIQTCAQYPIKGHCVAEIPGPKPVERPDTLNSMRDNSIKLDNVLKVVEEYKLEEDLQKLLSFIGSTFSSPKALRYAFIKHSSQPLQEATCTCDGVQISLNWVDVTKAYKVILSASMSAGDLNEDVLNAFASAFSFLRLGMAKESVLADASENTFTEDPSYLNPILIALELPLIYSMCCEQVESCLLHVCYCIRSLQGEVQKNLVKMWHAVYDADCLRRLLGHLHHIVTRSCQEFHLENMSPVMKCVMLVYITSLYGGVIVSDDTIAVDLSAIRHQKKIWQDMNEATGVELLWEKSVFVKDINVALHCNEPMLPRERFINDAFCELAYDNYYLGQFASWISVNSFMLRANLKRKLLYLYNTRIMRKEYHSAHLNNAVPYLLFHVQRNHLVTSAIDNLQLVYNGRFKELHKPIHVDFEGEPGLDEGGVSNEFFQLYIKEVLNPIVGMFRLDEGSGYFWINPSSPAGDKEFTAVGLILGLAIYNGIVLDVQLPPVLYRKLAGRLGCLKDLETTHPNLCCSLHSLLAYKGATADVMTYFSVSQKNSTGEIENFDLINGGSGMLVTGDNKHRFVELYADFLLNKQVERQFATFALGFHMVTDRTILQALFTPQEMVMVVSGDNKYDFQDLQNSTKYEAGYTGDYPVIKQFWEIAHEMDEEQKRQLLKFTTGSDRVPMGGLSELGFVITNSGPDTDQLPTAHTCFQTLLLPKYSSKEKLKERLLKAIEH